VVWGRVVPDIPAFCRELQAALAESREGLARQQIHHESGGEE
jgi:hypothetical protein